MTPPYFCIFVIISPLMRAWSFIWTKLKPLHPRMMCTKFGWIWPSGSWEEVENVKSLRRRRRQRRRQTTDKFWSEKLTWAFGSGELKSGRISPFNLYLVTTKKTKHLRFLSNLWTVEANKYQSIYPYNKQRMYRYLFTRAICDAFSRSCRIFSAISSVYPIALRQFHTRTILIIETGKKGH